MKIGGGGGGWWYQKPEIACDQQRNLPIPFETKDYCRILSTVNECRGRQRIQANQGFQSGQGRDAFQISWAHKFICTFPLFALIGRVSYSESKSESVSNAHNNPSMVRPTMVSRASKNFCKKSTIFTSTERSTERSRRKIESTRNAEFTATSGLDNIRQNVLAEEMS